MFKLHSLMKGTRGNWKIACGVVSFTDEKYRGDSIIACFTKLHSLIKGIGGNLENSLSLASFTDSLFKLHSLMKGIGGIQE